MTGRVPGGATKTEARATGGATPAGCSAVSGGEGATSVLSGVESELEGFVRSFEPARFSGDDAASLVRRFARIEHLAQAGKTLAARRAADSDIHRRSGQRSGAEWLAAETGESLGDALDTLKLGENLGSQPGVEDALRGGKLSPRKARLISGAVKENPGAEADLLAGAETDSLRTVQDKAGRARAQRGSAEDERRREERLHARRSLRTWTDPVDGMTLLHGRFAPLEGARLRSALERTCDQVFRRNRRAGIEESRDAYMADALVELVATGTTGIGDPAGTRGAGQGQGPDAGAGQRPDAGAGQGPDAGQGQGTGGPGGGQRSGTGQGRGRGATTGTGRSRGPYRTDTVHVRVDLAALRAGFAGPGQRCEIPGIGPISVERAREIMGDALLRLVITDGVDVPCIVNLKRGIPAPVASALLERDPVCVISGCDQHRHLQIDHWSVDFAKQGPTQWWNLVRLCPFHHGLKTRGYFHLDRNPDHSWSFTVTPKGRAHGYGPVGPPPADPDPPDPDPPDPGGGPTLFPHTE